MIYIKKNYKVLGDGRGLYNEEIIEMILENRKIQDIEHFLNPVEEDMLPLESLKYINKAKDIIDNGIKNNERFLIVADTDLDGVSSGTIMYRYLNNYTDNIKWTINEGKAHGLINQDTTRFINTDILIIVDSLDKDNSIYKELFNQGIKIIILDHHYISEDIDYDSYVTLISSQREYDNPHLSGAGVVWKFCKYLDKCFVNDYADKLVDLAACGLIADMSDVSEQSKENRYICYKGLNQINNPAIKKIVGSFPFNSTSISFSIAPLINAAQRMNMNESAMKAFLADDNKEVLKYIKELKQCKTDQNIEVDLLMDDIIEQGDKQLDKKVISIFIDTDAEIAGLIGNRLLERYQRPVLILKEKEIDDEMYYTGSARAIGVDDFRQMCEDTKLCEAKGHELAHGINIKQCDYSEFISILENKLKDIEFEITTVIDIDLNIEDINRELIDKIKIIDRISGEGFKPITVRISNITEYEIGDMSQKKHLVIKPTDYLQLIRWNWNGDWDEIEDSAMLGEPVTVIGNLDSGFLARKFVLKVICNEIEVG